MNEHFDHQVSRSAQMIQVVKDRDPRELADEDLDGYPRYLSTYLGPGLVESRDCSFPTNF